MKSAVRSTLSALLLSSAFLVPAAADGAVVAQKAGPGPRPTPQRVHAVASEKGRTIAKAAEDRWDKSRDNGRAALAEQRAAKTARLDSSDRLVVKRTALTSSAEPAVTQGKPGNGDYAATPLAASSSWQAGSSSGSFSWSYPFPGPPTAAGPVPRMSIGYDSGSVDGRTPVTNNQTSVVGEGFDLTTSYIERTYLSCSEDGHTSSFDLCWHGEQLQFVLDGNAAELVPISADEFRLKSDDGTVIKRKTGADNGDNNGEYWVAVTTDGTEYTFGMDHLPGWTSGAPTTDSTWTVPVFSDDTADPAQADGCKKATFDDSWCQQAWRWNLDLVEDTHGNAATYWYAKETNHYARNGHEADSSPYSRGGYLSHVDYGLRANSLFDGAAATVAPQRIAFAYGERCLAADCSSLTEASKYDWPDVPFDSICGSGDTCTDDLAPTFFTRKRLTTVTASIGDAAGRRPVDRWDLAHIWVDPGDVGDTTDQILWPSTIQHTGLAGTTDITERPLKLTPTNDESMRNRVDSPTDGIAPLIRPRLSEVITESGAVIDVTYSTVDCAPGDLPTPATNKRRCFPTYWAPYGGDPAIDWFNKYVVTNVMQVDTTTGDTIDTEYQYGDDDGISDDGAWHYDANPQVADAYRTWSQWRGYSRVATLTGVASAPERAATVSTYYRGMDGDRDDSGGTKNVDVPGIQGPDAPDSPEFAGLTRETVTYLGRSRAGAYGPYVSGTIATPWSRLTDAVTYPQSTLDGKTASAVTVKSFKVRDDVSQTWTRVTPASGASVYIRSRVSDVVAFDDYGLPTSVDAYVLADGTSARTEQRCTQTWYARSSTSSIVNKVSRTRVLARSCADAGNAALPTSTTSTTSDVISDTATVFDDADSWSAANLTRGDASKKLRATSYANGQPNWQLVNTMGYDALGRQTSIANANNVATQTAFSPSGAGLPDTVKVTNSKGWTSTTTVDPARMSDVATTDINGKLTEKTYDALGRLTAVWTPIGLRALGSAPTYKFAYEPGGGTDANGFVKGTAVATYAPKGNTQDYIVSYEIYDALLRLRQTQIPSPSGGRVIQDTQYDDRGLTSRELGDVWDNTAAPAGTRQTITPGQAVQTDTAYDGANRPIAVTTSWGTSSGRASRTTRTTYTGDSTAIAPPSGASARRVITDALGRTTENRTYSGNDPAGTTFVSTRSTYDARGLLTALTGPDSAMRFTHDALGRARDTIDPDRGTTTTDYDSLDRVTQTTDGASRTISTTYDELDRKIATFKGVAGTGTPLSEWKYDAVARGQLASATRYTNGAAYSRQVVSYDGLYRPTKTRLTLPQTDPLVAEGTSASKIPATLDTSTAYNRDGTVQSTSEPAVAGLPAEVVSRSYTELGLPQKVSGASGVVLDTAYNQFGDPVKTTLGVSDANTNRVWLSSSYDGLRRPATFQSTETNGANHLLDLAYTYDPAGKITKIADASPASGGPDYQCFVYDGYQRLATAWTPKSNDCALSRSLVNVDTTGGPYWHDYTYKPSGLRATQVIHAVATGQVDKTVTSTYGGSCGAQAATGPHVLTQTVTTKSDGSELDRDAFCANAAGETTTAEAPNLGAASGSPLTLTWNEEGRLLNAKSPTAEFTNVYDADGNLLIRRPAANAVGVTTLYLGATEVKLTKSTTAGVTNYAAKGYRYYSHNGNTVAIRTGAPGTTSKLTFEAADRHGTTSAQWDALAPATRTKRYSDPFGNVRGTDPTTPAWADDKRFLGMPTDVANGLTHIGARDYMPEIGRFLSADPVLSPSDPQSLAGFTYADNDPINLADPSGLVPICTCGVMPNMLPSPAPPSGGTSGSSSSEGSTTPSSAPTRSVTEAAANAQTMWSYAEWCNSDPVCAAEGRWMPSLEPAESKTPKMQSFKESWNSSRLSVVGKVAYALLADDAVKCIGGSAGGCSATAANVAAMFIPGGQLKYITRLDDINDIVRAERTIKATEKMREVRKAGKAGEDAAGIIPNTKRIEAASGKAAYRIPDELNDSVIGEVKNVSRLRLTSQLKDFLAYAEANELTFNLYVRESTTFSKPLQELIDAKVINRVPNLGP